MMQLQPKPPGGYDGFYINRWLDAKIMYDEQRNRNRPKEDYPFGIFTDIRGGMPHVFSVTELYCPKIAAYKHLGIPPLEDDTPNSLLNMRFGTAVQSFFEGLYRPLIVHTFDKTSGVRDWEAGYVGFPDDIFRNFVTGEFFVVDFKRQSEHRFRLVTRRGVPRHLLKTRFYQPFPWDELQIMLYLRALRIRGYRAFEHGEELIRIGIIKYINVNALGQSKLAFVEYDEVWVEEIIGKIKSLRDQISAIEDEAAGDTEKIKQLIADRIVGLPLEDEYHAWCDWRHICPIGQEFQLRHPKRKIMQLWKVWELKRKRAKLDLSGQPVIVKPHTAELLSLFPEDDPGMRRTSKQHAQEVKYGPTSGDDPWGRKTTGEAN